MVVNGLKIGAIIQARLDSSRLPGKVLLNLPINSNETILSRIVNRLKNLDNDLPIIATSNEPSDDLIERFAVNNKTQIFRGSKDNVLQRYIAASDAYNLDIIIRITGDNPIVLIELFENAIQNHINSNVEYSRNIGLPVGTSFEIINVNTLKKCYNQTTSIEDLEHVTLFIKNRLNEFNVLENDFSKYQFEESNVRLTVDYPSDYAFMNILFQNDIINSNNYNFQDIKSIIERYNWLPKINNQNVQKKQQLNINEELEHAKVILENLELNNAAKAISEFNINVEHNK